MAARMYNWSRRSSGEYGTISESPALLRRFRRENQHPESRAEAAWLMADRLGGCIPQPQESAWRRGA